MNLPLPTVATVGILRKIGVEIGIGDEIDREGEGDPSPDGDGSGDDSSTDGDETETRTVSKGVIHLSKPVSVSNLKPDSVSVCT